MFYDLILFFPKEQYSIEKGNNKFVATDKEGNRFIMAADNEQKGKISFCKDEGSECKPKQHYTVKDPKVCNRLSDIDSLDHVSITMKDYDEKYFQSRILGGLDKHNIDYGIMEDGKMPNMLSEDSII